MLSIGEFASLTGLTVKALHHYDESGLLEPARTDPASRYRFYAPGQVRAGTVVRLLRDAGVPLAEVAEALRGDPAEVLDRHRRAVLAAREREDRSHAAAAGALADLVGPVEVVRRDAPPQPYVGRVLAVGDGTDADEANAAANDALARLHRALAAEGAGPVGPFWTALRAQGVPPAVEVVACWPTAAPLPADWGGAEVEVGVLPARTELAARWRPGGRPEAEGRRTPPSSRSSTRCTSTGATPASTRCARASFPAATGRTGPSRSRSPSREPARRPRGPPGRGGLGPRAGPRAPDRVGREAGRGTEAGPAVR